MAVQVTDVPGARLAAVSGQLTGESVPVPVKSPSLTVTSLRVTLPVFVTRKEYVISWSTARSFMAASSAVFTTVMPGVGSMVTMTVDGGETGGGVLPGGVPVPVAVLLMDPASTSAWVAT